MDTRNLPGEINMSCEHGHYITETEEIENPYTGDVETETNQVWITYMEYFTIKSDKCSHCGYIFDEY